ncbi:unnamed protein product [Enterobius vermicularis]|uniref:MIT domain-containing protein n=1 Tax=Enterobius vermicularis TaxID=51028 RepID=A0A0N4UTL0_ENTVE|nr:unnamed protein product [Enterobius vermicularis]
MEDVTRSAQKAIDYDKAGRYDAAIYFYGDAAQTLLDLIQTGKAPVEYKKTAEGYISRAEIIKARRTSRLSSTVKSKHQQNLERAEFLLYQALDADKAEDPEEAVQLYMQAVDLCLLSQSQCETDIRRKLRDVAKKALDRAEILKSQRKSSRKEKDTLSLPDVPTDGEL